MGCPENLERIIDEEKGEYKCTPKRCEDRNPWRNKSCSLKEDFLLSDENWNFSIWECYYLREEYDNDNMEDIDVEGPYGDYNYYYRDYIGGVGRCVGNEKCPSDFPGV